ncbi:MAG: 23S rRNA methyltransferase [Isosphaeraceae bacterium]|jgi:23S rRNA (cytosine1962-C5)-methyltransferase|nr:MAG: 23S rRNA methyltransferase [Isosphaeraceae bacterium]
MSGPRVILRPKRARPFFARHPWVLAGSIDRVEGHPAPGDEVAVWSAEGVWIARGLYNPASRIPVRLYRWEDAPIDGQFVRDRLGAAVALRREVLGWYQPDRACRLVYSESDGLSGLVVDAYAGHLLAQFGSLAFWLRRETILTALAEVAQPRSLTARFDRAQLRAEGLEKAPEPVCWGAAPSGPIRFEENGLNFVVQLDSGQKTGFYLDQRENRAAVARLAPDRRVLDLFCYTGGFALHAARAGAVAVEAVDSSRTAIDQARHHAQINGLEPAIRFVEGDGLRRLEVLRGGGQRFDLVICDPPKYAPSHHDLERALSGYLRLNRAVVDVVEPGGLLVTCSCSGAMDRWAFQNVLAQSAELAGRTIQILEIRGQAADHPIAVSCPETEYLKCLIARVL